jgi:hypothetical protein
MGEERRRGEEGEEIRSAVMLCMRVFRVGCLLS